MVEVCFHYGWLARCWIPYFVFGICLSAPFAQNGPVDRFLIHVPSYDLVMCHTLSPKTFRFAGVTSFLCRRVILGFACFRIMFCNIRKHQCVRLVDRVMLSLWVLAWNSHSALSSNALHSAVILILWTFEVHWIGHGTNLRSWEKPTGLRLSRQLQPFLMIRMDFTEGREYGRQHSSSLDLWHLRLHILKVYSQNLRYPRLVWGNSCGMRLLSVTTPSPRRCSSY